MRARTVGRYLLCEEFASGGMASVLLGVSLGDEGFRRLVAIKRLHPQFAKDPEFVAALVDEGRMQARVHHPNVAAVLDVVRAGDDVLLVMEYIHAAALGELLRAARTAGERCPLPVARAILVGALRGLHAAHEARSASGEALQLVHRDVSPQNILVGVDGVPRVVDFGIAHAVDRSQVTRAGMVKGKPGYMTPEQLSGAPIGPAVDVYAAGVVSWELLTGERLFPGGDFMVVARAIAAAQIDPPSAIASDVGPALDAIVLRALERAPAARFPSASAFADALEALGPVATPKEVGAWVERLAGPLLAARAALVRSVEGAPVDLPAEGATPSPLESGARGYVVSAAVAPRASSSRRRVWIGGGALLAASLVGALATRIVVAGDGSNVAGGADAHAVISSAVPVPEPPAAPLAETADPPHPAPVDHAAPAASASDSAERAPPPPGDPRPNRSARAASPPNAAARKVPCTTVGADGIKRWNPACK